MKIFLGIGSGPGIGLATAERFAREGFQIILSARDPAKTRPLAEALKAAGHTAATCIVDASDPSSITDLIEHVERDFGEISVLHYNAASIRAATILEQPTDSFNSDLAVNIGGAMIATQAIARKMGTRGIGTILLTGGGLALHPHPDYLSLSIGKAGIRALASGVFESLKAAGIHVATVTVSSSVSPQSVEAQAIAEQFWTLHSQPPGAWQMESVYPPDA